jgi:hypothetical protein
MPALTQTVEYRKAYLVKNGFQEQDMPQDLKYVASRQDLMWETGRQYHIVIPQMALYTVVAARHVHRAQLDRLERMLAMPNVKIGIIPLEAGSVAVEHGPFALYDDRVLINAHIHGDTRTTNKEDILTHRMLFDELQALACYGAAAVRLIRTAAEAFAE